MFHCQHVPPLPYGKKLAIQTWNYMGSVKVALIFTRLEDTLTKY